MGRPRANRDGKIYMGTWVRREIKERFDARALREGRTKSGLLERILIGELVGGGEVLHLSR